MHDRRTASSTLSAKVINYLREHGHRQADIAKMLHVSEGYISLVKSRERSLTIDHLEMLSSALSVPLGALLIAVTKPTKFTKESKVLFDLCAGVLEAGDKARGAILRDAGGKRSRRSA
jgi:transcriptional regulator with XRE-family HTH domain